MYNTHNMSFLAEFLAHPPYRMVFMSGIALSVAIIIMILYTKVYPKKTMPYWLILLIIAIPPIISVFREGIYESGDFHYHAGRTFSFYNSLNDGVIFPRWSAEDNAYFGYALFSYVYPFPYYFTALFYSLGLNLVNSVKVFLVLAYILSGLSMYAWLKSVSKPRSAFLGAVFYLFAPYHLIDLHFRTHIGEVLTFTFLPLSFLFLSKAIKSGRFLWMFLTGMTIAFTITSHPAVALVGVFVLGIYSVILCYKKIKKIIIALFSILLGLLTSAYYWIPFFLEKRPASPDPSELTLLSLTDLLYSPWRFGLLFQGPEGEYSLLLGYAHWIVLVTATILIIFKVRHRNSKTIFFLLISMFMIFILHDISRPIWENFGLLGSFGVTYRVLVVISFTTSTLAALIIEKVKSKRVCIILVFVAIFSTILNWGNRGTKPEITDAKIVEMFSYLHAPNDLWQSERARQPIQALEGELEIIYQSRSSVKHIYLVNKIEEGVVQENTYYFPGWKLYVDGSERKISYDSDPIPKMMKFDLEPGIHEVVFIFDDTPIRFAANMISVSTIAVSGIYLFLSSLTSVSKNRSSSS